MRICILGAGSLGSALGALLAESNEVTLIGRKIHVDSVRAKGLSMVGERRFKVFLPAHDSMSGLEPPDLIVVAAKAYSTESVIETCRSCPLEHTKVLTLQNGLGNIELLREWAGARAFGGTTTMGATMLRPGVVRLAGVGRTVVGSDIDSVGARAIEKAFSDSGIPVKTSDNIHGELWAKAIVNASINPLTAILGVSNGQLICSPSISRLMGEVCRECERVARAAEILLPYRSMATRARRVAADTSKNTSSMLQDVMRGRRTEIREINGYFCRIGRTLGVGTVLNDMLVSTVEAMNTEKG
jgi:2-dehydropantoate 2-reductase